MKISLVICFITILSMSWGKRFMIKTKDTANNERGKHAIRHTKIAANNKLLTISTYANQGKPIRTYGDYHVRGDENEPESSTTGKAGQDMVYGESGEEYDNGKYPKWWEPTIERSDENEPESSTTGKAGQDMAYGELYEEYDNDKYPKWEDTTLIY